LSIGMDLEFILFYWNCYFIVFERVGDRESIFCVKKRGFGVFCK